LNNACKIGIDAARAFYHGARMMKHSISIPGLLSLACIAIISAAPMQARADANTPLTKEMKAMGKNYKQLKGQIADVSKKESSLAILGEMVKAAEKSKALNPKKTEEIPADKREQFLTDYHKAMDELIAAIHKIEAAVNEGKPQEAAKLLAELNKSKRSGHEKFSSEED
jgi:soluble cytochrome b562